MTVTQNEEKTIIEEENESSEYDSEMNTDV